MQYKGNYSRRALVLAGLTMAVCATGHSQQTHPAPSERTLESYVAGRSVKAVARRCKPQLGEAGRLDEALGDAKRQIQSVENPGKRARRYHCLGLELFRRAMDYYHPPDFRSQRPSRVLGERTLRQAVDVLRVSSDEGSAARPEVLLSLADTLVRLGEYHAASDVLAEYASSGGDDPLADDLRCWTDFVVAKAAELPGAGDQVVRRLGAGVRPPSPTKRTPPQYTRKAKAKRIMGAVVVGALIDEGGDVVCAKALSSLPEGLDRAAAETVGQWEFEPATVEGKPVAVVYFVTVNFSLH